MGLCIKHRVLGKGHPFTSLNLVAFAKEESNKETQNAKRHPNWNGEQEADHRVLNDAGQASNPSVEGFK